MNTTANFTLAYDAVGNLTDDGEDYEYEWDAFGRLRKVKNTSGSALIAEYRYNGLGFRIAVHEDTDTDGDVDGNDLWYYDAFDEQWRQVARFRESDTSPKEEFVPHAAGDSGFGGSSYMDLVVCRDKDANTAWTSASDGTLEERVYYCQNWRADVSAIVSAAGGMLEWAKYSAYGVPFGLPGGDTDSDGDCDAADATQIQSWINAPAYDVRGDIDVDGDVDANDKSLAQGSVYSGIQSGRGVLSVLVTNQRAFGGGRIGAAFWYANCRARELSARLGRWISRDGTVYNDGANVLQYVRGNPITGLDASGYATLERIGSCTNNACGAQDAFFKFRLSSSAGTLCGGGRGWVVQEINVDVFISTPCPETEDGRHFWEGFLMSPSQTSPSFEDTWHEPPLSATGFRRIMGRARFFCESTTGNLTHAWGGGAPQSGAAPSTYVMPSWWNSGSGIEEGPAHFKLCSTSWQCCKSRGGGDAIWRAAARAVRAADSLAHGG